MCHNADQELVAQCLEGCASAWQQLYARAKKTVSYIVRWKQWGFNHHQIEEVGQEALNGLLSALETFDFSCSLETFASTIARNKCVSEIRRQCAAKRAGERCAVPVHGCNLADTPVEKDELRLLHAEEQQQLARAFRHLEESSKTILRLRYYDEFSYRQIAEHLQIPAGTVASRLKRSLAHLRKKLVESTDEF